MTVILLVLVLLVQAVSLSWLVSVGRVVRPWHRLLAAFLALAGLVVMGS